MNDAPLRVGALAHRTGLTVRTLHHYDEIGLLTPSARTDAGHRLYGPDDVARLYQVVALRSIGLPLDVIRSLLDRAASPLDAVERQLAHLRETIEEGQRLVERLEGIAAQVRAAQPVAVDDLLHTIHLTTMFEKHYTPGQLDVLKQRRTEVGEERIREVQEHAWPNLWADFRKHLEAGTPATDSALEPLVRRAETLIAEFTGGNASIRQSLGNAVQENRQAMHQAWGIDEALGTYYAEAMAAFGQS